MCKYIILLSIFIIGEILFNLTWFKYLKSYFKFDEIEKKDDTNNTSESINSSKQFLLLNLSTFKGIMERFTITMGLVFGFTSILIVFGTIKLGTRFKENQDIKNDYFLIGNFSSILISIFYCYLLKEIMQHCNIS